MKMKRFLLLALILVPLLLPAQRHIRHLQSLLEMPTIDKKSVIIDYGSFVISYNSKYLIPNWVAYELTSDETNGAFSRKGKEFRQDNSIKYRQAAPNDYRKSGWSKGHLAPAADFKWNDNEMWDTFYFTNCAPQNMKLNNGPWATLENKARESAKRYGCIWIVTGTLLKSKKPQTIGSNRVAVPDAFYKAMLLFDGNNGSTENSGCFFIFSLPVQSMRSEPFGVARAACFEQLAGVFASCGTLHYAKIFASLKIKNGISLTPLNCALNAFTLALNDSADAFVERLSK